MDMEVVGETNNDQLLIVKGRRTKRQRPSSPFSVVSSSSLGGGDRSSSSPMNSNEFVESTDEEEDMANCLILLAQGNNYRNQRKQKTMETKDGLYVYQCKTCDRCFSSFQALGGHRASHKKPKTMVSEDNKKSLVLFHQEEEAAAAEGQQLNLPHQKALFSNNNKSKVHECSICGSEFSSGQALGGHMRRHRTPPPSTMAMNRHIITSSETKESMKSRTLLALDLNLPAPEEEGQTKYSSSFSSKQQPQSLIFSASPMVDCHY